MTIAIKLVPWASSANYATGTGFAWAGTAQKIVPAYAAFQPSPAFAPSAQEFNAVINARDIAINSIIDQVSIPTFLSGYPLAPIGGGIVTTAIAFDPIAIKWMAAGLNATAGRIGFVTGRGDPGQWTYLGGGVGSSPYTGGTVQSLCRGIEPAVANKYVYGAVLGGIAVPGDVSVDRIDTVGLTHTLSVPVAMTDGTSVQVVSVSGAVAAIIGATGTPHSTIYHTIDHGVTWVATGLGIGAPIAAWLVGQSVPGAGQLMAIPEVTIGTSGGAYWTSTDAITWTLNTSLAGLLAPTETPTTLCYGTDAAGAGCWILTTATTSVSTNTYRSYNGTMWTAFANNVPANTLLARMAAVGQQLIAVVFDTTGFTFDRVVFSVDGGATWLTANTEALGLTAISVAGSNNQFLLATDLTLAFSTCAGSPGGFGSK